MSIHSVLPWDCSLLLGVKIQSRFSLVRQQLTLTGAWRFELLATSLTNLKGR